MRVISGKARGRKLRAVSGLGTRPITDRAKTALFNILGNDVVGSHFLDLFAGTGQVGIEALSRRAARAVFVEQGAAALRTIHANLKSTQLAADAEVIRADVFRYLMQSPHPYDYIYIAPPQYRGMWAQTLGLIDQCPDWLMDDGWAIVQINPAEYEALAFERLAQFDQRTYGGVMLCFYGRQDYVAALGK